MSDEDSNAAAHDGETSDGAARALSEEEIREKMREMTANALRSRRIDAEGVKEVGRVMGAQLGETQSAAEQTTEAFSDAMRRLDADLMRNAHATHAALSALAEKGSAVSNDDLNDALTQLKDLHQVYLEASARVAEATSGSIQHELHELAHHAQKLGTEASSQVASLVTDFANRMAETSTEAAHTGLDLSRKYGMRMAYVTSGVLAGIADALREQSTTKKSE